MKYPNLYKVGWLAGLAERDGWNGMALNRSDHLRSEDRRAKLNDLLYHLLAFCFSSNTILFLLLSITYLPRECVSGFVFVGYRRHLFYFFMILSQLIDFWGSSLPRLLECTGSEYVP